MPKPGFYAVRKGKKRGIFHSWGECESQVKGFPDAEHKKFKTQTEAEQYLGPAVNETLQVATVEPVIVAPPVVSSSSREPAAGMNSSQSSSGSGRNKRGTGGFYAVRRGYSTGIFNTWTECQQQISGYSGECYAKFPTLAEAEAFLKEGESTGAGLAGASAAGAGAVVEHVSRRPSSPPLPLPPPSTEPVVLSTEQYRGLKQILAGHHVFLSGSAGTGKSFLVQLLKEVYLARGRRTLAVTASTGCAACGVKGQTIHAWAGVGTGLGSDLSAEELFYKLGKHNKKNWKDTDVLLIDEISMISAKEFDKLSELGGLVRGSIDKPFGGLQVVLCGDFFQLPPVSKAHASVDFCFEAKVWKHLFPSSATKSSTDTQHESMVILSMIHRQKEPIFQRILNSLRFGIVTPEVDWFLRRKSTAAATATVRNAGDESSSPWFTGSSSQGKRSSSQSVKLFSRVADVKRVNISYLNALPSTDTITISSMDSLSHRSSTSDVIAFGKSKASLYTRLDQETPAHATLQLKVGAQVMLIANLDTTIGLVNGTRGRIIRFETKFDEESGKDVVLPVVRFAIESSNLAGVEEEKKRFKSGMEHRLSENNRGYEMFARMGYQAWNGLGKDGTGASEPIQSPLANQRSLGLMAHNVNDTVERTLEYFSFHLKDNYEHVLATRRQVPLILAYALTIHKTQGMSIPDVEVNMEGIFTSGQAYVALSRATSADGLKITGYRKNLIFSNPEAVTFYENIHRNKNRDSGDEAGRVQLQHQEGEEAAQETSSSPHSQLGVTTSVHDLCNL